MIPQRDLSCDPGDRVPGRLRCQRRGTADTRIHFNDDVVAGIRIQGELDVAAAFDAEAPDDLNRRVLEHLVFFFGDRLGRRNDDAVSGMHANRIDVFHIADDDAVVRAIPHDFIFDFFPAGNGLLQEDLPDGAALHPSVAQVVELLHGLRDAAAGTAQRVRRPDDDRQSFFLDEIVAFLDGSGNRAGRHRFTDLFHERLEGLPVFGFLYALLVDAQQFHIVSGENAFAVHLHSQIEPGLSAESGKHPVRALSSDDLFDRFFCQRFHIDLVRDLLVCHDRSRVAVDEDRLDPFLTDGFAGLCACVIEFRSLTDDDRARSDNQYFLQILFLRHISSSARFQQENKQRMLPVSNFDIDNYTRIYINMQPLFLFIHRTSDSSSSSPFISGFSLNPSTT